MFNIKILKMKLIEVLTTRFGLILLGIVCLSLIICCLCKYCSKSREDKMTSRRSTMSNIESLRRREKFIKEFIDLRRTLKTYLENLDKTTEKEKDVIVVVSPGEIQLGKKIEH